MRLAGKVQHRYPDDDEPERHRLCVRKRLLEEPQKKSTSTEGTSFENPSESFMFVVPATSNTIATISKIQPIELLLRGKQQ